MRLAVFSDSHGRTELLPQAVRRTQPDIVVHLGDHLRDSLALQREFPGYTALTPCPATATSPPAPRTR